MSCYGCTFVVPEGKYSEVKYTKNSIQLSVQVAQWIQRLPFDIATPVQNRVLAKSNNQIN